MEIDEKYRSIIREALSDYLYKVSLELNDMKGKALTDRRKELTSKQKLLEELRNELIP